MLKIYLARHGQDEDNRAGIINGHRDMPLTELGRTQAQQLATYVVNQGLNFDKIYSSPLKRAFETASTVAKALNIAAPEVLPLLIERNFGVMSGEKISDIEKLCAPDIFKTETITYFLKPEGAETFPDLIIRANELLEFVKARHQDGNILLCGHGDFGKMVYAAYYNLNWQDVLSEFRFGNSELVLLSTDILPKDAQVFKNSQYNS